MTPHKIVNAYATMQELINCVLPYKAARRVHKLYSRLTEEYNTILQTEKNMVAEFDGTFVDNYYKFPNSEIAKKFNVKYNEFINQEDDIELPHIDLSEYTDKLNLSAKAIESLKDLINFGEE